MIKFKFSHFEYQVNIVREDNDFISEMNPLGNPYDCDCYLIDVPEDIREFMSLKSKLLNPKTAFLPRGVYTNLKMKPRLCDGVLAIQYTDNEDLNLNNPRFFF